MPRSTPSGASALSLASDVLVASTLPAPISLAIWMATTPTQDDAALMSTDSPRASRPLVTIASCSVVTATGKLAASSNDSEDGMATATRW